MPNTPTSALRCEPPAVFALIAAAVVSTGFAQHLNHRLSEPVPKANKHEALLAKAAGHVESYFRPSLDCMDSAQFLLVPAVALQQTLATEFENKDVLERLSVQCDAVIKEIEGTGDSERTRWVRYWVTPTSYQVQILWEEPATWKFPYFGPGLLVQSTPDIFRVSQAIHKGHDAAQHKPVGTRPTFRYMFGDYPTSNLCYDETDVTDTFTGFSDRVVRNTFSTLFNEGSIQVGFHGRGIKVWDSGTTNYYPEILLPRCSGKQTLTVECTPRGPGLPPFPARIMVQSIQDQKPIGSARIENVRMSHRSASSFFGDGLVRFDYLDASRRIAQNYGTVPSKRLSLDDAKACTQLISELAGLSGSDLTRSYDSIRRVAIAANLARYTRDSANIQAAFCCYLTASIEAHDVDTISSGFKFIDLVRRSGDFGCAKELLKAWLRAAITAGNWQTLRRFLNPSDVDKHPWESVEVSRHVLETPDLTPTQRFEMLGSQLLAIRRTKRTLINNARTGVSAAQTNWTRFLVGTNCLEDLVSEVRSSAQSEFHRLAAPTQNEISLAIGAGVFAP